MNMLSLIRFLERPGLWTDLDETTAPVSVSSPLELLIDICMVKGKGASYVQVDFTGPESLSRAVAAYISNQSALKPIHVGIISMTDIQQLGISVIQSSTPGADTVFSASSHFDLNVSGISQAIEMAQMIRKRIESVAVQDVQRYLFWSINQGYVSIGKLHRDLLTKLAKEERFILKVK